MTGSAFLPHFGPQSFSNFERAWPGVLIGLLLIDAAVAYLKQRRRWRTRGVSTGVATVMVIGAIAVGPAGRDSESSYEPSIAFVEPGDARGGHHDAPGTEIIVRNSLEPVSAVVEWTARLAAPAVMLLFAVCSVGTALDQGSRGAGLVASILIVSAGLSGIGAALLAVRAVRRLRHGPPADPPSLNQ